MAHITGIAPGLVPQESAAHEETRVAAKSYKPAAAPSEIICDVCQGQVGFVTARKTPTNPCKHCSDFFGMDFRSGVTDVTPEAALEQMAKLREAQWGMILIDREFGVHNSSDRVGVEMGDVFQVSRAGHPELRSVKEKCNKDRTWSLFTVDVQIGPHKLTLFPHEISAMSWLTIMDLKKAGELIEQFVCADDRHGHFAPNPDLRVEIKEAFGRVGR